MHRAVLLISVATALGACTSTPPDATPVSPPPMIAGGYGPSDLNDPAVKAAQALAESEIYKRNPTRALVEKVSAEGQVVAGKNYRFTITMTGGASYRVTVFKPLQGEMSVTAYEKLS